MDALAAGKSMDFAEVDINGDDLIFLQYTGGTTGLSKGAMLTHRNLVANITQFDSCVGEMVNPGKDVVMTAIPMYHIFALMVNTLTYFKYGGTNVLITNPRDMPAFVEEWSKWKVTVFTGVNTLFNGLLHTPGFEDLDFSELVYSVGGGSAMQKAVSDKWKAVTGNHIKEGYGLSETSPILTLNPFGVTDFKSAIGVPAPSTDISLRDDDGNVVAEGERGELCAKGPQVMKGYWRNEEATAEVMTDDGYFCTGDIAVMDETGFFRIVDRKKDMILVSGFNVFPNEIEAEIAMMDGVLECACVGVPNEKTGEAAKVFVVKKDESLTAEAVRDYCKERLTGYKVPRHIAFIDELPKSTVGKILRRELRDL
jgi:long-chain acyl-CoA synthetase